ncbi:hypothetical protein EJ08DRAFT_257666 [Tothia fuscella]|uniref:DUF7726 domain-containing protein n=1 Tax=Tothia fuscella TaxID=1048955 RepID=A0A9P4NR94_9PEZI|nr:hypothetical protein EJ08DRAFT_257666 [Tothia fuscella]
MSRPLGRFTMLKTNRRHLYARHLSWIQTAWLHTCISSRPPVTLRPVLRPILLCATQFKSRANLWQDVSPEFVGTWMQSKPADTKVDRSCEEVRRLINKLIDCGEFTIGKFVQEIAVSRTSYNRFMHQNGSWNGEKGDTFPAALQYFQQREKEGIPMPRANRRSKTNPKRSAARTVPVANTEILLEGEADDKVPVFDTCDEVRRKITWRMRRAEVTPSAFLKALSAQYHTTSMRISPNSLAKFRASKGPNVGNANPVFYAAYVFFEKERIKLGKSKIKAREVMEKIYGHSGGVNVNVASDKYGGWVGKQEASPHVYADRFGIITVHNHKTHTRTSYGPEGCLPSEGFLWQSPDKFFVYT